MKAGTLYPKTFLIVVLNNPDVNCKLRIDAARTLLSFMYSKIREVGQEEGQQQALIFPSPPPVFLRAVKEGLI